jgi:hypothetical protein
MKGAGDDLLLSLMEGQPKQLTDDDIEAARVAAGQPKYWRDSDRASARSFTRDTLPIHASGAHSERRRCIN